MSAFFQQLIDIGEEKAAPRELSKNEMAVMDKDELLDIVQKQAVRLSEKEAQYEALKKDSQGLRSEYDAYKRKTEQWNRQAKEAREADRKLIEELRSAGGASNEVFLRTQNETIQKLKEQVFVTQREAATALQKQREAETARIAAEESKRTELRNLGEKIDEFQARYKSAQQKIDSLTQQVTDLERRNASKPGSFRNSEPTSEASEESRHLQIQVETLAAQLEQLRGFEKAAARKAEDADWEMLQKDKKIAEAWAEVEKWKSSSSSLASKLEEALSDKEAALTKCTELESGQAAQQEQAGVHFRQIILEKDKEISDLLSQLDSERGKFVQHEERMGEAKQASMRISESFEQQRKVLESQVKIAEGKLKECESARHQLTLSITDLRDEAQHREAVIQQLEAELQQASERISTLESQLLMHQKSLGTREEDLLSKERERQRLLSQLDEIAKRSCENCESLSTAQETIENQARSLREKERQLEEMQLFAATHSQELARWKACEQQLLSDIKIKDNQISQLNARLAEAALRATDIMKVREDQSAKLRQYESRLKEAEHPTRAAPADKSPKVIVSSGSAANSLLSKLSWNQWKAALFAGVAVLFLLGLLSAWSDTPKMHDEVNILREKYAQAEGAAAACRALLRKQTP